MSIRILLLRNYEEHQTKGKFIVFGKDRGVGFKCLSLELKWLNNERQVSCIPEDLYECEIRYSAKYGRHIHIKGVPNRSLILVHPANYAGSLNPRTKKSDLLGCVAVGDKYVDIDGDGICDIANSKKTFEKVMSFFPDDEEKFKIAIIDETKLKKRIGSIA